MSAFDEMVAARITMQEQIDELTARLNAERAERMAADNHAQKATEEAVALWRAAIESIALMNSMAEAVAVLQAEVAALKKGPAFEEPHRIP
jgi:hypothetical protein